MKKVCSNWIRQSGWRWDIDKIGQMQVTDNVVDLMVARITRLPHNARKMLKVCACMVTDSILKRCPEFSANQ